MRVWHVVSQSPDGDFFDPEQKEKFLWLLSE